MAKFQFKFGRAWPTTDSRQLTAKEAREYARGQEGQGYVWMFNSSKKHWVIVANYADGSVYNGQSQIVPCAHDPEQDWKFRLLTA